MRAIREWICEMDHEEKKQFIGGAISFGCMYIMIFMLSVLGR